jgi:hypothetical protein
MKYLLQRISDGWYLAPGSKHTSNPGRAIELSAADLPEWKAAWPDHKAVRADMAKEILE